ncbi:MAG: TIGR03960 family B12-binding radical SAM protein [Fibrobacteraceae bacterium]|nr:TIGR03960 family B12-binding radical SAM protein [Fibrobacteraceae bacterium]
MKIFDKLSLVLPSVENPARYMGGEANSIVKEPSKLLARMAFVFPDLYEIGLSNNGLRILYHVVNRDPELLCEVAFAPWDDMAKEMARYDIPLYTHATWTPVRDFDVVGMTLQTELNFTNVPYVLELARVAAFAKDRKEEDPIVIGGGPAMANPEPVADFFDAFCIGDGEELLPKMLRTVGECRKAKLSRIEILENLSKIDGCYVPAFRKVVVGEFGMLVPELVASGSYANTDGVRRVYVEKLSREDFPVKNLIANMRLVHNRFCVEVMRGCTQGCRFCQAGIWYRPCRELPSDDVMEIAKEGLRATGEQELGLLSLSTADYKPIEALTDSIIDDAFFDTVDVSLPSIRVSSFGETLAEKVAALKGGRSGTFAPETGSERLRKMINKTISDEDMYNAAEHAFSSGFNKIKLYTMIGFPTENEADMEAFCGLIENLVKIGRKYIRGAQIAVSIGILIPKPFTALEWAGFASKELAMSHVKFVRERFYKHPNVKISWADWSMSRLEAFYSRGDRSLSKMIYEAYKRGMIFESDNKRINPQKWEELWKDFGYDEKWIYETRAKESVFPWDFIHAGVTKSYLWNEYQKGFNPEIFETAKPVPNCKWGECQHCGIPGGGKDVVLAENPVKYKAPSRTPDEIKKLVESRRPIYGSHYSYKITFQKTGISRFLPHQNMLGAFVRSFGCCGIPLRYSEGFSPKPRIINMGALPLGLETVCEIIGVETLQKLDLSEENIPRLIAKLSEPFPMGMKILKIETLDSKLSKNFPTSMTYSYKPDIIPADLFDKFKEKKLPTITNHRGQEVNLNEHILELSEQDGKIIIRVKCNDQGGTMSPFALYGGLMGLVEDTSQLDDESRRYLIRKEQMHWD